MLLLSGVPGQQRLVSVNSHIKGQYEQTREQDAVTDIQAAEGAVQKPRRASLETLPFVDYQRVPAGDALEDGDIFFERLIGGKHHVCCLADEQDIALIRDGGRLTRLQYFAAGVEKLILLDHATRVRVALRDAAKSG